MNNLLQRVVMALLLVPLAIGILWLHSSIQVGICALVGIGCLYEWFSMAYPKQSWKPLLHFLGCVGLFAGIGVYLNLFWQHACFGLYLYMVTALFYRKSAHNCQGWLAIGGAAYIALAFSSLLYMVVFWPKNLVAFILATVWVTDIGAYFTGKWLKGPRMAPVISPNKTWSGFFGGVFWACVLNSICWLLGWMHSTWIWASIGIALAAHGGDLLESWVKRKFGVKDSGRLIPGHGGLLDRLDSLMGVSALIGLAAVLIRGLSIISGDYIFD